MEKIQNDQQFLAILHVNHIDRLDFESDSDFFQAAIETKIGYIADYIIKHHKDKITAKMAAFYSFINFGTFKRLAIAAKDNAVDVEDMAISCFEKLEWKCHINTTKIAEVLFDKCGANPNGKNGMVFTQACRYGLINVVRYLVEIKGADVNANDEMGYIFACRFAHYDVAKYLVENGASYKTKNELAQKLLAKDYVKKTKTVLWLLDLYKK